MIEDVIGTMVIAITAIMVEWLIFIVREARFIAGYGCRGCRHTALTLDEDIVGQTDAIIGKV